MESLVQLVLVCLATFLGALAMGSIPFIRSANGVMGRLEDMTGLAAGFLIAAAMLVAIPEGIEILSHSAELEGHHKIEVFSVGIALMIGFLFMMILEAFGFGHDIHEEHHDHSLEHGHDHLNHPTKTAMPAIIGLTAHAFIDGMVIAAAMAEESAALTLTIVLVIMMHKFPAAFSISAFSLHERKNRNRSKLDLLIFAAATPVAILVFWNLFVDITSELRGLAILFSAGTFLYIATVDVLPAMHERSRSKRTAGLVLIGVLAIFLLTSFAHSVLDLH
tara:strand:+ start:92344 stop:93174 length:831 start_codon:yes stop_codon:yes gene_type:complete